MKLSEETIKALGTIVTGDNGESPYQRGHNLVSFFNQFSEEQDEYGQGFPSRWQYAEDNLRVFNNSEVMHEIVRAALDPRRFVPDDYNLEEVVEKLNFYLQFDGYELGLSKSGFYEVRKGDLEDPTQVSAHFFGIKSEIIESIQAAEFLIWVAVAWFTDSDLGNELVKKMRAGVNVQIIVNDDDNTAKNGLKFEEHGFEYFKVSPLTPTGNNIMHHKFCVIDLKKVIQGSYNWTSSAQYNSEDVSIVDDKENALKFARRFIELKLDHKISSS